MRASSMQRVIRDSLLAIHEPRLFRTERGYQGAFQTELDNRIKGKVLGRADLLVESEYQKTMRHHGLKRRPDVIVHVPYERGETPSRRDGNHTVLELKRRASPTKAKQALQSIEDMMTALGYQLGVFINIDSDETHFASYTGRFPNRVRCFATRREGDNVVVWEEW